MPKDSGERTAMWMLLDQLTQNIVLKNNDEHSDPQAALLDINVERVINDIKTMETVLNKQENISSTPSSPNPSRNRSVSHSYTQRHKHQQNRKKSLSRNISYDSSLNHSLSDISFSGDISRNSIKRRTTAYTSYSKKKKHYSYGKKAKYVVLKTSLVKKINEIASLNAQLNEKKKELNALEQTLDRQAKEASRRDDLESSFYMSESSSFNDLKYNLKSASSTESFNGNSMILKDSDLEINDSSIMDESFLSSSTSSPLLSSRLSAIGKNNSRSSLILNSPSKNVVVPETTTNGKSISNIVSTNTNNNTNDTTNDTQKINIPPPPPPPPPPMMQSSNNSNIPLPPPPPPIISSTNTVGALPPPPPPPPPSSLSSSNAPPPPPPPPPAGSNVPPAPPTPLTKNKNRFATMAVKAPALPGMMNKHVGILAKKTNLSSKPLKSLNWTKIPPYLISETIWKDIDDTIVLEELSDELPRFEDIFSAFQHKKKVVEQTDDQDSQLVKAKPKLVTFLDPKRSQNCCIMLRAVKLDSKQIKQALMTADHHNLSKDIIPELLKFCPTEEEYALVKMYEATDEKFDLAEQFFLDISKIDHYEDRLKALQFKCCFQEYVDDIFTMINWYDSATNDLIKSKNFKNVLKIILALGNYMNSGNRGGAYGFQISSIAKLVDTKTVL
ncbi:actin-binding FH2 [Neocallimastix californiae]|uniref:Actin-binding FH2 n=1 Tax=Neocallimastix californiae TaxID=1754190 RepID=A0A1Y1YN43_9FUNG|nr:actin-binding FH2 [Neocallimastix californiae]|eukprot:ORX99398.1 actin-binding FH2 [Neocallimastix californiae]